MPTKREARLTAGQEAPAAAREWVEHVVPTIHTSGGWGLYFVGRLSDRWGVSRKDATCVWFEVDRTPHTAKRTWRMSPSRTP